MSTPKWAAGTLYPTGSLVQPLTGGGATSTAITNAGFESGSTDWTLGTGMSVASSNPFSGTSAVRCIGTAGAAELLHDEVPVNPGQSITATCMYQQGGASSGQNPGNVFLRWFTSAMVLISDSNGSVISSTTGDNYKQSTVTAVAPAGSAFVSIGGKVNRTSSDDSRFDNFAWNYAQAVAPAGLIYKAVQPTIGTSDATEPVWPLSVGLTVVDNTVIWEALIATRITYEASPILLSGATEPTWPEAIGEFVSDNTISWKAVPQQVIEAPQSKVVTIASSKVYAADGDIVRYCATVNPLDWTTADDAGYLPTGLNQYGSNRTAVLNTYRGNVVPFSASTFLCYQADPDPANITQLDAMEGVGSTYQQAAHPVANDLFYLSQLGVRTVGIAVGTANLSAGDAGAPIDPLVQAAVRQATIDDSTPLATYYPSSGQYWLAFPPPAVPTGPIVITGEFEDATIGVEYQGGPLTALNSFPPLHWEIAALPPGLSMNISSVVTGTPTATGTVTGDVTVTDRFGRTATAPRSINVIFSAGIVASVAGDPENTKIMSGDTDAYPIVQATTISGSFTKYVSTDDQSLILCGSTDDNPARFGTLVMDVPTGLYIAGPTFDVIPSVAVNSFDMTRDGNYIAMSVAGIGGDGFRLWIYKRSGGAYDRILMLWPVVADDGIGAVQWSPDGVYLACCQGFSSAVKYSTVYKRVGDVMEEVATFDKGSNCVKWAPSGEFLSATIGGAGTRIYRWSAEALTSLVTGGSAQDNNGDQVWSKDGSYIYAATARNYNLSPLAIYQWTGSALVTLTAPTQPGDHLRLVSISPDGRLLLVGVGGQTGVTDGIWIYTIDGGTLNPLAPETAGSDYGFAAYIGGR